MICCRCGSFAGLPSIDRKLDMFTVQVQARLNIFILIYLIVGVIGASIPNRQSRVFRACSDENGAGLVGRLHSHF